MKNFTYLTIALLALVTPLSAPAAVYDVVFSGPVYEYSDENGDFFVADEDFTFFDIFVDGQFRIDTGLPESSLNNWANTLSELNIQVADFGGGSLFDFLTLDGIVDDGGSLLTSNSVFVGSASSDNLANVYLQDFFVGNVNLDLVSSGPDFNNDIGVFDLAATGSVGDVFDLNGFFGDRSNGSFQTNFGEYAFDIQEVSITLVPVPAAVWLFVSGLMGLIAVARRRTSPGLTGTA